MAAHDPFLNPGPQVGHLHNYRLRADILRALTEQLPNFSGTFLDVGCGRMPYKKLILSHPSRVEKYIGIDVEGNLHGQPDLIFDGRNIPLPNASVDAAMATEVLEHCAAPTELLGEIVRVLRLGGIFFFTVPFLWPLHEVPHDHYRYTPFSLRRTLSDAGFEDLQLPGPWRMGRELGTNDRSLAYVPWNAFMEEEALIRHPSSGD